jgi:peptide/nickel transport system substrate-binding protein
MTTLSRCVDTIGRLLIGAVLIACVSSLTGCGSDAPSNESSADGGRVDARQPHKGGWVTIGVQQEPERLSEILNATAVNNLICNLIFSKFVKYDDELRLVPDLIEVIPTVENGGISPDYLTYTYMLRKDAFWHDGSPVTSEDVRFTFEVIMDPKVNVESREGWNEIASLETPDPHTVVFRLKNTFPDFVSEIFFDESVLPRHLLEKDTGEKFHLAGFHHAPTGSGPFVFKEWKSGSYIVLTRNDRYYGEGPYLAGVNVKFIPDENTLLVQLKTGEVDVYDNADMSFLGQLETIPGINVCFTPTMMYEHIDLNTENEILCDKRVRQALGFATNRQAIADVVFDGRIETALLDEYPTSKYYDKTTASRVTFDPLKARRLLRDAGWADENGDGVLEKDGRDLVLGISTTAGRINREKTQLVLKEQYRDVGIDLRIRNHNSSVLYASYEENGILKRGEFDLAMYAWLSSPEPATKADLYSLRNIPPNGQNHPRIRHPELTALLEKGANEIDVDRRIEIYRDVTNILVDEVPVIPLFWYTAVDAHTTRLQNFKPNPTQSADTWNAHTWYLAD